MLGEGGNKKYIIDNFCCCYCGYIANVISNMFGYRENIYQAIFIKVCILCLKE